MSNTKSKSELEKVLNYVSEVWGLRTNCARGFEGRLSFPSYMGSLVCAKAALDKDNENIVFIFSIQPSHYLKKFKVAVSVDVGKPSASSVKDYLINGLLDDYREFLEGCYR